MPRHVKELCDMKSKKQAYLFSGIILGFGFVVLGLVIDYIAKDIDFYKIHELYSSPLHFLILSAPLVLGTGGFFLGRKLDANYLEIKKQILAETERSKLLLKYTKELNSGNVDFACELLNNDDEIGEALRSMKLSISRSKKVETKRMEEDRKQSWIVEGLASFGEILRENHGDFEELGYTLISKLVQYIEANQGGIYLIKNSETNQDYLQQLASFAYDRRKYLDKEILLGEGLIGTCAIERETIVLKDIPENYINITSGLGKSNPKSIILVPLKNNEEVVGVIEIASLNFFQKYQIEFLEKIGESITATFLNVRKSQLTKKLLEESNIKSQQLAQQEEELRQNIEEMQSTKEETERQRVELDGVVRAMNTAAFRVEYDLYGNVIDINDAYVKLLGISREEALKLSLFDGVTDKEEFRESWNKILNGKIQQRINKIELNSANVWLNETYSPIYNNTGNIKKVLKLAFNISEMKQQEVELKKREAENLGHLKAINNSIITATFDLNGHYIDVNARFEEFAGIEKHQIIGKHHSEFMDESMRINGEYKAFWNELVKGKTKKGGHQYFFNDKEKWIYETFTAIQDENGDYNKIILLGNDITKVREKERNLSQQIEFYKMKTNS